MNLLMMRKHEIKYSDVEFNKIIAFLLKEIAY